MRSRALVLVFLLAVPASNADAEGKLAAVDRDDQAVLASKAFLDAHPDMKFRVEGFIAYDQGRFADARAHFARAAEFADKPSQAMLAEMAWKGIGQPQDRPLGYVWADLAAERGYRQFVAQREAYWSRLAPEERARALELGPGILATYGDASARQRLARHLQRARRAMISGRPRKDVTVMVPGPYGMPTYLRGHDFYAPRFWEPRQYQAWVDALWKDPPVEHVEVGPVEGLAPGDAAKAQGPDR